MQGERGNAGLFGAGLTVVATVGAALGLGWWIVTSPNDARAVFNEVHTPSLVAGMMLGVSACGLRGIKWLELPRRMIRWVVANEPNLYLGAIAAVCLGVLVFY